MILHIDIKSTQVFVTDSSRMEKKLFFQALLERFISLIYGENPNSENQPSPLEYTF